MNELEFERFLAESIEALQKKNLALEVEFRLGSYARWDHDGDFASLIFSNPDSDTIVEASTTDIGSYSLKTQTWLWAWANESHSDAEREKASRLQRLAEVTGLRLFTDPHFDCDEELAWELAAASVRQFDSLGCYRAPVGHLWTFLSIDRITMGRKQKG